MKNVNNIVTGNLTHRTFHRDYQSQNIYRNSPSRNISMGSFLPNWIEIICSINTLRESKVCCFFRSDILPRKCKKAIIIMIPKKNTYHECESLAYKKHLESLIGQDQAGFHPRSPCIGLSNTLRTIIKQQVCTYVDFEKAFNSINWKEIWSVLPSKGNLEKSKM